MLDSKKFARRHGDIQHRRYSASFGFTEKTGDIVSAERRRGEKPAQIKYARCLEKRGIDFVQRQIRICADAVEIPPILPFYVEYYGA